MIAAVRQHNTWRPAHQHCIFNAALPAERNPQRRLWKIKQHCHILSLACFCLCNELASKTTERCVGAPPRSTFKLPNVRVNTG
jgi:hypothetical protein